MAESTVSSSGNYDLIDLTVDENERHPAYDGGDDESELPESQAMDSEEDEVIITQRGTTLHDDVCNECGEGGDLICCETCTKVYHFKCAGLESPPLQDEDFKCPLCRANVPFVDQQAGRGGPLYGDIDDKLLVYDTPPLTRAHSEEAEDIFPRKIVDEVENKLIFYFSKRTLRSRRQRWTSIFPTRKRKKFLSAKQAAELFIFLTNYKCKEYKPTLSVRRTHHSLAVAASPWPSVSGQQLSSFLNQNTQGHHLRHRAAAWKFQGRHRALLQSGSTKRQRQ